MKKAVMIALVCVNVALLLALTLQITTTATAQDDEGYYHPPTNYILVAGQIESGYELVYVIDMANRGLAAIQYDLSREVMIPFAYRDLTSDFRESR